MRIGLILAPTAGHGPDDLAAEVARITLADALGFARVWVPEDDGGTGASALIAAAAPLTTSIRLGLGLATVDPHHRAAPAPATDVTALDELTAGRLDVATGPGGDGLAEAGRGPARQAARAGWEQGTALLARALEDAAAVPGAQRPHPPIWAQCDRPADISVAARMGLAALCRVPLGAEDAGAWVAEYRTVLRSPRCTPVTAVVVPQVAVCVPLPAPGAVAALADVVSRYAAAGVDELLLVLPPARGPAAAEAEAALRAVAADVLPGLPTASQADPALGEAVRAALGRRALPVTLPGAQPAVAVPGPVPAATGSASAAPAPRTTRGAVRTRMLRKAVGAGQRTVARAGDRRLERTVGSRAGLRLLFAAMGARFVPAQAGGFTGTILFELRDAAGEERVWGITVTPAGARATRGPAADPALRVQMSVADFVRLAAGELDPGHLLLSGRMELVGDFGLAMRLGPMFGL